jgi:hypothetical protein
MTRHAERAVIAAAWPIYDRLLRDRAPSAVGRTMAEARDLAHQALEAACRAGFRLVADCERNDLAREHDELLADLREAVDECGRLRAELERRPTRIVPAPRQGGLTARLQRGREVRP